jgi:hypothetical protein
MINNSENLAKSSAEKIAAPGSQFDHRPVMPQLRAPDIRHRVDPGDVPPEKAARRLGVTLQRFNEVLPRLLDRGFPPADPDTGCYDLDAIDQWRRLRTPKLFGLTIGTPVAQAEVHSAAAGMGDRFIEAKEQRRHRGTS